MRRLFLFWRELVCNPRQMGALVPSGRSLAVAVADEVRKQAPGYVLELGAGTGAITQALLEIRSCMAGYSVLEKSPQLADVLTARYPGLNVAAGCASTLAAIRFPEDQPLTVVSSLPFRSMQSSETASIRSALEQLMMRRAGFRLIQYSYFPVEPFSCSNDSYRWYWKRTVLMNLPPAMVWALDKHDYLQHACLSETP